ncbi:MAG TPA: GNAT family N-acetyltransferase [Saprospiraceae bacterium]|nr:GNAT family N-acetyltransferase [Saprospiraceae bacterium]
MKREERKTQYKSLVQQGKIKSLFLQPWWLDATGSWDVSLAFRNDQVIGAMPFALRKKWGMPYIGMPALTHHMRIWMEKPIDISDHKWLTREKQIIWSLIEDLPPHGFFSLVFAEKSFDNWLPFHWKGFHQEMRYTFVIEGADEETIDLKINRNLKRNIRQASEEVKIRKDVDPEIFFDLCRNTYRRQKMAMPYSYAIFEKIDTAIMKHDAGVKLGAYSLENKLVAVAYLLLDKDTAYYFLAGDDEAGRDSGASILICREALRIAFEEKKVKTFDFCGSMLEPITEIRRQFGARTVPLMKIFKAKSKILDIVYKLTR